MKLLGQSKTVGRVGAIALVVAALVFAVASVAVGSNRSWKPKLNLGIGFTITSTISSSPTTQIPALLYPGTQRYLWYSAHNSLNVPIVVSSMSITSVKAPAGCSIANLNYSLTTFSGSLVVPPLGTNGVSVPISLVETHTNQDACENKAFNFVYTGVAHYAKAYATKTFVASSLNPSVVGQAVTYTATVIARNQGAPSSPTGTVTFEDGGSTICTSVAVTSTGIGTATATCSPPAYLAVGIHYITAVYSNADGNFSGSTSPVLYQVVLAPPSATRTVLTSSPNPSALGGPVTLTATVAPSSGPGTPSGTVDFYSGTPSGTHTLLGTGTLNFRDQATLTISSLPAGANSLYAVYVGAPNFSTSTSPVISQVVIARPSKCTGNYSNWIDGQPGSPIISVARGDSFVYLFGANYFVHGSDGNDCFYGGNGNNVFSDGNGNDCFNVGDGNNVLSDGNGNDIVVAGKGNNTVTEGNGSDQITVGNGTDTVTVGNGSNSDIALGNGTDTVTVGSGSYNVITLGSGSDVVTIQGGSRDTITSGNGTETINLGSGSYNTYNGSAHAANVCHLPAPPSSWHGTAAAYFHDTITNCTVVTS